MVDATPSPHASGNGGADALVAAIAALEAQRGVLGDAVVDTSVASLRDQLDRLAGEDATVRSDPDEPTSDGAGAGGASVGGTRRRRQVTVLFADVAGFTALSEHLDVEDVGDAINALWEQLDAEVFTHGGVVDKHIGDAVMAVWGTERGREDDAERAVRCALAMQAHLDEFADRVGSLAPDAPRPSLRVGVNTGQALVTPVGLAGETTALGDAVNTASRIEAAAGPGEVLIGRTTYRQVRGVFTVRERPPLKVKGKTEPLDTYLVEALRPRAFRMRARGLEGVETRMVGRDEQLATLVEATAASSERGGLQVCVVDGEAGVGKSRLHEEYRDWLELHGPFRYFLGAATEQTRAAPHALLRDLLAFRFEVNDDDSPEVVRARLVDGVVDLVGEEHRDDAVVLGHVVGWGFDTDPAVGALGRDAERLRDGAARALQRVVAAAAEDFPVVIVLEDLHWADTASLDLVERLVALLADESPDAPVTLVVLTRPELLARRPDLLVSPSTRRIRLDVLGQREVRTLVEGLFRLADHVPEELLALVEDRSGGNPFFAEEVVAMLVDARAVLPGPTRWVVDEARLGDVAVPSTVTEVVVSRLDRLGPLERRCLEASAVLGSECWDDAVATLLDEDHAQVRAACKVLEERELLLGQPTSSVAGTTEYGFRHAIIRDVAYDSLLRARRSELHRAAARWVAGRLVGRGRGIERTIAQHHELGGEHALAGRWFRRAGEQEETRSVLEESLDSYRRAIELGEGLDRQRALVGAGRVANVLGRIEDADASLAAAVALGRELGDDRALLAALAEQGRMALLVHGDLEATWADEGLDVLPRVDDPLTRVRFLRTLGSIGIVRGDHEQASARLEEALALARPAGLSFEVATLANNLAHVRTEQGRYDEAVALAEECRRAGEAIGNHRLQMGAVAHLGFAAMRRGDHGAALECFQQAQHHNRAGGDREKEATVGVYLALCRIELGEVVEARDDLLASLRLSVEHRVVTETVRAVAALALLAQRVGDTEQADRLAGLAASHPACSWEARQSLDRLVPAEQELEPAPTGPFDAAVASLLTERAGTSPATPRATTTGAPL